MMLRLRVTDDSNKELLVSNLNVVTYYIYNYFFKPWPVVYTYWKENFYSYQIKYKVDLIHWSSKDIKVT